MTTICVDASFILNLVLDEAGSDAVHALWAGWLAADAELIVPCHALVEAASVVRNRVHRQQLTAEEGAAALAILLEQGIVSMPCDALHARAWELAAEFDRPTAYDAYYLALAEAADCELWTADRRLARAAQDRLPWVKSLPPTG
jgi:predicted nucleic acid-binding protein